VDGWKPTVDEFARTWLGISRPDEDWLEAVSTALLGNWVDLLDTHHFDDARELGLRQLKKESDTVHRQLQPLFRRKARGGRLLSLDHPTTGGGAVVDLLADQAATADSLPWWEPENDHAAAVFQQLSRSEQHLARTWATAGPCSWAEAAELASLPATDADSVRRKLRRLGHRHQQRRTNSRYARRTRSNP
jgi:hypothetical protein